MGRLCPDGNSLRLVQLFRGRNPCFAPARFLDLPSGPGKEEPQASADIVSGHRGKFPAAIEDRSHEPGGARGTRRVPRELEERHRHGRIPRVFDFRFRRGCTLVSTFERPNPVGCDRAGRVDLVRPGAQVDGLLCRCHGPSLD